ncbi:NAD-dependent epimerase/dehydratase family protein [Gangjinia marincola]|uniref:NAD-dependent epimerase/dehydratase family protein n=1 Tax=Gangjinia marincola TaxID=578463 RepID=A0ABN1MH02_9FLAO
MKILVTGAAGFIGSHLSEELANNGHDVTGVDNFSSYYSRELKELNREDLIANGVNFKELDLREDLSKHLSNDFDVVYHFAAQPGISASTPFDDYLENNVLATQNLLSFLLTQKRKKMMFVNIATSSIYGFEATSPETAAPEPVSDYGVTKLAAEQLVMAAQRSGKIDACSIRCFSVYGPRERPEKLYTKLIASIFDGTSFPLYEGSLSHERSFTYVGDIVKGLEMVLNKKDMCNGEIINLGSDEVYTTGEGISLIEEIIGKKANFDIVAKRPGDQLKTSANIDKAKKLLNYHPTTSFKDGLKKQVTWYEEKFRSN